MGPLDLSQRPPRPCRAELDGIMFLPRSIDKARATLPGGNLGPYIVTRDGIRTLSGMFFRRLGLTAQEWTDAVAAAPDDAAVAGWLRGKVDRQRIDEWNALLAGIRMRDLEGATLTIFMDYYEDGLMWAPDDALIDVIDADDRRIFQGRAPAELG
jgi:hypothetical protein